MNTSKNKIIGTIKMMYQCIALIVKIVRNNININPKII